MDSTPPTARPRASRFSHGSKHAVGVYRREALCFSRPCHVDAAEMEGDCWMCRSRRILHGHRRYPLIARIGSRVRCDKSPFIIGSDVRIGRSGSLEGTSARSDGAKRAKVPNAC
jgi:hypothetical protein